jgi:type III secretion system HrpE/YscL family protein
MTRLVIPEAIEATLVPGDLRRAQQQAAALIRDAQQRADLLLRQAERQADALIAEARAAAAAHVEQHTAHAVIQASSARDRALADARDQVMAMGMAAAEKILGASLTANPALLEDVVRPLLAKVRRARRAVLRVHPTDAANLAPRIQELATESGVACPLRLEVDESLHRGSCVLVSDLGVLDARLETRLELVARALEPLVTLPER